ncbi:YihY/virulence factor BrkB family protein [Alkaliphilus serpentinus]|uniref:YihY/virulence factor BrkB family protein n=1 Tax=Alkaliphilus serpentinus TaxID=1482731 RepID=A0A833HR07_9FIRM|nr:YihY/virulence factor BrkB family protein [Alkaliphilus serpentinus]KAB3532730.1 YihY/virulence factor BrkB family protein [Alkaliphilus serpentinus]
MKLIDFKSKGWYSLIIDLAKQFGKHEVPALAAQVTYYLILSFFPFLIFLITLVSYTPLTSETTIKNLLDFLPYDTYIFVIDIINQVVEGRNTTLLSIGMITTLIVASNGVRALIRGINKSYNLDETRPFWKKRIIAILFTIALSGVILLSLVLLVFGHLLAMLLWNFLNLPDYFKDAWSIIRYLLSLAIQWIIFACIYIYTPERKPKFNCVILGTTFATFGWLATSFGFATYVNNFGNYASTYGSIGGIIVLLIWLYLSSIIILTGAEINGFVIKKNNQYKNEVTS